MGNIDLHSHSTSSDGTDSPSELVQLAIKNGLSALALTDHDNTNGIDEALSEAKRYNTCLKEGLPYPDSENNLINESSEEFELIPGIEISTEYEGKEVHIVGLYIDYKNKALNDRLAIECKKRTDAHKEMCRRFQEHGINVVYEDLIHTYPSTVITRAHFADYLVKMGACGDRNEVFARYIGDGKPMYVYRSKMPPKEAIELIRSVGGFAVFAHPILCRLSDYRLEAFIQYMKEAGLGGIEAYYSTYEASDTRLIERLAKKYDLALSGGSDHHGRNKPNITLGRGIKNNLAISHDILDVIKERRAAAH